jgi:hypothetical protein
VVAIGNAVTEAGASGAVDGVMIAGRGEIAAIGTRVANAGGVEVAVNAVASGAKTEANGVKATHPESASNKRSSRPFRIQRVPPRGALNRSVSSFWAPLSA